jgi:hypothetical protein
MSVEEFDEAWFRGAVARAQEVAQRVLDTTRCPVLPEDVPHTYTDKYLLAETLTNTAIASLVNALSAVGLDHKLLGKLVGFANEGKQVSIRFIATETCQYLREEVKYVDSNTQHVVETSFIGKITSKTVTKVIDHFWLFKVNYQIFFFPGNDHDTQRFTLLERMCECEVKTGSKQSPVPETVIRDPIDCNATWLFKHLTADLKTRFAIRRDDPKTCHTPRRNDEIEDALDFFYRWGNWASNVSARFTSFYFPLDQSHKFDLSSINSQNVSLPLLPLFEEGKAFIEDGKEREADAVAGSLVAVDFSVVKAKIPSSVSLSMSDTNVFLAEQLRTLNEKKEELLKVFAGGVGLVTSFEAGFLVVFAHTIDIKRFILNAINYIEDLMKKQLIAAIGKEVDPSDFAKYMVFHNRKLMKPIAEPKPFCYAVRRPDHYPEGIVSLEAQLAGETLGNPVYTQSRQFAAEFPMQFALNAAVKVSFYGDRFLHGWMLHRFGGESSLSVSLNARARQFSSFVILVGNIASSTLFLPKFGMIIQNKDDLQIPLMLEQIPTAQEFRDAIESLSPEQQDFAKAYRSLQLESTLFGVVVLQIKPQLEKLLKLPYDSLTKEIRLTQDLQELFIKYQIPSDLLSYAGDENAPASVKVDFVKSQVKAMYDLIDGIKKKDLAEQESKLLFQQGMVLDDLVMEKSKSRGGGGGGARVMRKAMVMSESKPSANRSRAAAPRSMPMPASASVASSAPAPAPAPAPTPAPTPAEPSKPSQTTKQELLPVEDEVDLSSIPNVLDAKLGNIPGDSIRPTIIKSGSPWTFKSQPALLSPAQTKTLGAPDQEKERNRAYDLLDALSRSGSLPFDDASLHVVVGLTHCFEDSVLDTLIKRNVNPIERVERSSLIMAAVIQDKPVKELIKSDQVERLESLFPSLLEN